MGEVTVNNTLITGNGANHIWFVGITIEAGRGDGIIWNDADGLVLINVTVRVRESSTVRISTFTTSARVLLICRTLVATACTHTDPTTPSCPG